MEHADPGAAITSPEETLRDILRTVLDGGREIELMGQSGLHGGTLEAVYSAA